MDGRTVKEDTVGYRATEASDEGPDGTLLCIRSKGSRDSNAGLRGAGRDRAEPPDSGQVMTRRSPGGPVLEDTSADVLEGRSRTSEGLGVPVCTTGNTLVPVGGDRCCGSYVHLAPRSPFTHVVHGFFPSHFWRGGVSLRVS